jgi:hypothetical protein
MLGLQGRLETELFHIYSGQRAWRKEFVDELTNYMNNEVDWTVMRKKTGRGLSEKFEALPQEPDNVKAVLIDKTLVVGST